MDQPSDWPGEIAEPRSPKPRRPWFRALQLLAVSLVIGLLALLGWRLVGQGKGAELVAQIRDAKRPPAPAFDLKVIWAHNETWPPELQPALADGRIALKELREFPVVLNFWASWCIPCKEEAPQLAASAKAHAGKVLFLGIDVQDFVSDARRFLERHGANYISVRDGGNSTYDNYGLTGIPETYYLDRQGRIVGHSAGQVSRRELEAGIALVEERS